MRRDIEIEPNGPEQVSGRKTTVSFKLSYTGASGKTVADVTNALAAFYVAAERRDPLRGRDPHDRVPERAAEATKKQLDQHEAGDAGLHDASHHGELPQQVDVNLAALERLNTQLRLNGERQMKLLEDREKLTDGLTITLDAATGKRTATADTGPERIERMKHSLQLLESQYNSRYPDVVRLKAEIAIAEREREDGLLREREANPADAARGRRRSGRRATQDAGRRGGRSRAPQEGTKPLCGRRSPTWSSGSKRCRSANRNSRASLGISRPRKTCMTRCSRTRRSAAGREPGNRSARRAVPGARGGAAAFRPVAPNRQRLVIMGLMLAVAAGVGAVMAAEQFDTAFHDVEDLRTFTKVPVLASIPRISPGYPHGCCARSWRRFRLSRWSRSSRPRRYTPHGATSKSCGCWCAARNDSRVFHVCQEARPASGQSDCSDIFRGRTIPSVAAEDRKPPAVTWLSVIAITSPASRTESR